MASEAVAIVAVESMTAVQLFAPGFIEPLLERIKSEARASAEKLDISTDKGRREIASLAYKVARTKTFIDEQGKKLTEKQKAEIALIDAERRRTREQLDALKDEVRRPLNDWECSEQSRISEHEARISRMIEARSWQHAPTTAEIAERIDSLDAPVNMQEFSHRAELAYKETMNALRGQLEASKRGDAERAEWERLRKAEQEHARLAREQAIAEAAKREAEQEAAEREARLRREAAIREEAERTAKENAIRAKVQAEAAAAKAESERVTAIERAKADAAALARKVEAERREAERLAEQNRLKAIEDERRRVHGIQVAEAEAEAKREANRRHRARLDKTAVSVLVAAGIPEDFAKKAIELVAKGEVPNVRIRY